VPLDLVIKVGDTVRWENTRTDVKLNKAMVVGAQKCSMVRSPLLQSGDSWEYTFTETGKCVIVDGYITTNVGSVMVE